MGGKDMITLSPFYHSAVNAVTEPNRLVFCSRYLIERWSPLLGGTGLQILLYLRTHCFHDRRTGECRNRWQVSRAELARAVGVSEATVKRELAQNQALLLFVRPQQEYRLDGGRGGVRRDANSYQIAMDDPVHESDWPRVEAYVREAEAQREKGGGSPVSDAEEAKRRARLPETAPDAPATTPGSSGAVPASGHFDPTQVLVAQGQNDPTPNLGLVGVILTQASGQNDPTDSEKDTKSPNGSTLNVGRAFNCVDPEMDVHVAGKGSIHHLDRQVEALVTELSDRGSERRHRQLLGICERHGLPDLPRQALVATRRRMATRGPQGSLDRPGAYYQRVLVGLLEVHQVFVPTLAERSEEDPEEVRRLARESLGLDRPAPEK